jgi:hypothetical protein
MKDTNIYSTTPTTSTADKVPTAVCSFDDVDVDEDDFILVTDVDADDDRELLNVDESYDYCDDVFSRHTQDDEDCDDDGDLDDDDDIANGDLMKDSAILPLPPRLMRSLDDAHAAAKAAINRSSDLLADSSAGESTIMTVSGSVTISGAAGSSVLHSNNQSQEGEDDGCGDGLEEDKRDKKVNEPSTTGDENKTLDDNKVVGSPADSPSQEVLPSSEDSARKNQHNSSKELASVPPASTHSAPTSRTSNKKRRKKLKLMKKAHAAAVAAKNLSGKTSSSSSRVSTSASSKGVVVSTNSSTKFLASSTPRSSSSKKVANIAVICATESLAAYREEVMRAKLQTSGA